MAPVERILIVGGGIAGLTLATALHQRGMRAELIERSPAWHAVGAGIAVQNGMVMVSYINKLRERGMELRDAVLEGASVRLRAELLSALIGSISLIPFIISTGTGAEIEKPLAIVVVGGMVMSPIKIVFLPMVYEWIESRAERKAAARAEREPLEA